MRITGIALRFLLLRLLFAAACVFLGFGTAPSSAGDAAIGRDRILGLLRDHQLDELDRLLNEINDAVVAQKRPEWDLFRAFRAFQTSDRQVNHQLEDWVRERPQSAMAVIARGVHCFHLARTAHYVEPLPEQDAAVVLELQQALRHSALMDVQRGLTLKEMIPIGFVWTLEYFIDLGQAHQIEKWYRIAVNDLPTSPAIHRTYLSAFVPWRQAGESWQASLTHQKEVWETLRSGFAQDPDFGWLRGYLDQTMAETYRRQGEPARALERYDAALEAGKDAELLLGRGFIHLEMGDNKAAFDDFDQAVRMDSEFADAVHGRALAEAALGDNAAALADLDRAVVLDRYNPLYLVDRARVLRRLGRLDEARRDVDEALVYGRYDPWVQVWKGTLYEEVDRPAAAAAFKRAVELVPGDPAYLKRYMDFLVRRQDCAALPVIARYRELCEIGQGCTGYSPVKLEAAEATLKAQPSCAP
jgi:tetratricopeptide (TPR) repeat protein